MLLIKNIYCRVSKNTLTRPGSPSDELVDAGGSGTDLLLGAGHSSPSPHCPSTSSPQHSDLPDLGLKSDTE